MKIGLVCPYSLSYYGGIQNHVYGLYNELSKRGHQVIILVPKVDLREHYDNKNIVFVGGAINLPLEVTNSLSFGIKAGGLYINDYLKKEKFDILHFHNPTTPFMSWQILALSNAINIATFHADSIDHELYETYEWLIKNIYDFVLPKIDGFLAVSESAKSSLTSIYKKADTLVIPNGIDINFFKTGKAIEKYKDGKINLLCVSRLDERKGIFYLLEAISILKKSYGSKLRLILIGDGPQKKEVIDRIKKLSLESNIVFLDKVKTEELPNYYKTADLFIAPATHGESFGIVLIEAMASGLPIVAASNRGYKDVLKSVENDSLVPPRDSKLLAEKINNLLINKNKITELSVWGAKEVEKYSWPTIASEILNFYQSLINKRK